ncbi:hypothetical protein DFQ27_009454, partial [Actinomortierella ambigua]
PYVLSTCIFWHDGSWQRACQADIEPLPFGASAAALQLDSLAFIASAVLADPSKVLVYGAV